MLRVGLTGGIGSGKTTVARRLVHHGAVLVDSDVLAREAVAGGSDGLAAVVAAFGDRVLGPDGELDRPALARTVFGDPDARARLNAIVHPRVRRRSDELIAAAPPDAIVVQDVPLLVEGGMAPRFPLVVVVHADADERVRRLVEHRAMAEHDVRARIAAQASDEARRAAADVWLDNSGDAATLQAAVDVLWRDRLVPFEENLRHGRRAPAPAGWIDPDPRWPADAARAAARVAAAAGDRGRGVTHVGMTAVAGLPAPDVVELQLGVDSTADADAVGPALAAAGYPAGPPCGAERVHGAADPGRPVAVHVRVVESPDWRNALLVRDWLRADGAARGEVAAQREAAMSLESDGADALGARIPAPTWPSDALARAEAWAAAVGWVPSSHGGAQESP